MFFDKHSKEDEEIAQVLRRHPLTYFPHFLLFAALIALSFLLLLVPLAGIWKFIAFIVPFAAALIYGVRIFILNRLSGLMITSQRLVVVKRKGFFSRQVSEIALDKILDVSYQTKGIMQTLFNYGTVSVKAGGETETIFEKIPNPKKAQESIVFFQSQFNRQVRGGQAPSAALSPREGPAAKPLTAEEALERLPPAELSRLTAIVNKVKGGIDNRENNGR